MKRIIFTAAVAAAVLSGCANISDEPEQNEQTAQASAEVTETAAFTDASSEEMRHEQTTKLILHGAEGDIHYSFYLPENYDESRKYPLVMTMPGYDMMW